MSVNSTEFTEFWAQAPRKTGKKAAEKAWGRARKLAEPSEILLRLQLMKSTEWARRELRYIPYPATWLNSEDWSERTEALEDEHPEDQHKCYCGRVWTSTAFPHGPYDRTCVSCLEAMAEAIRVGLERRR